MRRMICLMLVLLCVAGLYPMGARAESFEHYYDPEDDTLTHLELLEQLCTGFPYVGYEKYPEVPQYFQDDYPHVPYGGNGYSLESHGCGITVLAMMATYMTEKQYLPDEFAVRYARYGTPSGTDFSLFVDGPRELGFALDKRSGSWREVYEALGEGKLVVSLQFAGYFTTTAHFILLTGLTEDGKVLVRDPSRRNHEKRYAGTDFFENGFETFYVASYGRTYWIYEKKVVRVAGCDRCADPAVETVPLFLQTHYCTRCTELLQKRDAYHEAMGQLRPALTE